jgi:hypothetical protein
MKILESTKNLVQRVRDSYSEQEKLQGRLSRISPRTFYQCLKHEERILFELKKKCYDDSWLKLKEQLNKKQKEFSPRSEVGKRVRQDILRASMLENYEKLHGVDLYKYSPAYQK